MDNAEETTDGEYRIPGCPAIELGKRIMTAEEHARLDLEFGVIDAFGTYHDISGKRAHGLAQMTHLDAARRLRVHWLIENFFIHVTTSEMEGTLFAPAAVKEDTKLSVQEQFVFTPAQVIALYNGVQIKNPRQKFEHNLSIHGHGFGFNSLTLKYAEPIRDERVLDKTMDALQDVLGDELFDRNAFKKLLTREKTSSYFREIY